MNFLNWIFAIYLPTQFIEEPILSMNTPSVTLTLFLCIILVVAPVRFFFFSFIMAICLVPMNQRLMVGALDLTTLRVLILMGVLRLLLRNEMRVIKWNKFDKLILSWSVIGSIVYIIQWQTFDAFINRLGVLFDLLLLYWLSRHIIRNWDDVTHLIKICALFAVITAPFIALEKFQESSYFSIFGPVAGSFHRGRFRCAGSFPHPIIMGCFWASLLPLFYAQIKAKRNKFFYWIAICAALSNVYFSGSSTPIMTVIAIIFFWSIYKNRAYGKTFLWGTCAVLFFLHLIMNNPVWHLLGRVNVFGESTGWHRFNLFDNFIRNTSEWFFLGTKSTSHWGYGLVDVTNQFVLEGVRGGFVTLFLFVLITYMAIKITGNLSLQDNAQEEKWFAWGLCVTMLGHMVTFWGVSYFGQINALLYITFAIVSFALEKSLASMSLSGEVV